MTKRNFELTDETTHLVNYYLAKSEIEFDDLVNSALKAYISDKLTSKQYCDALKHTGKDAFNAQEMLKNFGDNWLHD